MTRTVKPVSLCIISIDHFMRILMPFDKGVKLVQLLEGSFCCEVDYATTDRVYVPEKDPLSIELKLVKASQIKTQKQPVQSPRTGPLLLESD